MSSRFHIGDLTLDTGRHLLLRDSKAIALGPLTYKLLHTLVAASPNVVTHDELIVSIWNGRPVSPETISQRIKLLRDALSDDPHHPRYVELVRGQGYRLIPRVVVLPDEPITRGRFRWRTMFAAAVGLLALAAALYWFTTAPTRTPQESNSIAVLPFVDLSPSRDQQYLADGIAEEILNLLSKSTTLRVIARTSSFSFRDQEADIEHIADVLSVTHILEGSVRKAEERVRVTVRLVDAANGSRLWSESYDQQLGDILALQTDVARSVAVALDANLRTAAEIAIPRLNPAAYELYLHGQQQLRLGSFHDAERNLERAVALDAKFVPGYHGLGMAYILQVVSVTRPVAENRSRLREVVNRGLRVAPDDVGLLALSAQLARYDGDIALAEQRFATALEKDPSNGVLGVVYPIFKLDRSEPAEALAVNRRWRALDPLNPLIYVNTWACYMDLWDAEQALETAAYVRELQPASDPWRDALTAITRWYLSGDLAASKHYIHAAAAQLRAGEMEFDLSWLPTWYYFIDDLETADALLVLARRSARNAHERQATEAYRHLAHGEIDAARRTAVAALSGSRIWGGNDDDFTLIRLASEALIDNGEAQRVIDFLENLAPEYARYKESSEIDPEDFSPAPIPVKSAFSSFPALYFADYSRALRAIGDDVGAAQMLVHLERILELRRARGLFIEERHAAEAHALRGRTEEALRALEKAERDRTIYHRWQLVLLHNELFSEFRSHPRFTAIVERIREDVRRQRERLSQPDLPAPP